MLLTSPLKASITVEAGEEITELDFYKNPALFQFLKKYGISPVNIKMLSKAEALSPDEIGDFSIQFLVNGKTRTSILHVKDTKEPELIVKEVVIPSGDKVKEEDFILSLFDATKTEVEIKGLSSYQKKQKSGIYEVRVEAWDDGENKVVKKTKLYALPLKKKAIVQLGKKNLKAEVFLKNKKTSNFSIQFKEGFDIDPLIREEGLYNVPVTVKVKEGTKVLELKLEVKDTKPPVFTGIEDLSLLLGEEVSYRKGVSVRDNQIEEVNFTVDASKVNLKKEGSYPVFYKASDLAGNKVEEKRMIYVLSSEKSHLKEVRAFVRETLADLIHEGMSEEEKLRKIFDFCHNISYSGSSEKGDIIEAAYQGFKTKTGDCFTYYSMASLLLSEAGFTEKMVSREGGRSRHYWNLVQVQEDWYHFDSCPIAGAGGFLPFMVNDEELASFSNSYSKRYPERKGYYNFKKDLYPERAKKPFQK